MTEPATNKQSGSQKSSNRELAVIAAVFVGVLLAINWLLRSPEEPVKVETAEPVRPVGVVGKEADVVTPIASSVPPEEIRPPVPRSVVPLDSTNFWNAARTVEYWFDGVPSWLGKASADTGSLSNIRPQDYAGSESCKECHQRNYDGWHGHAHRRMNEIATDATVMGDFSGKATIRYKGGVGRFHTEGGKFRMETEKDGVKRVYAIERTIGSRFFQYYVGRLISGPELDDKPRDRVEHVLPFGYWLDGKEWVPVVRTFRSEDADEYPFDPYGEHHFAAYDIDCGNCHTTMPAGDWMIQEGGMSRLAEYTPRDVDFYFTAYLNEAYPGSMGDLSELKSRPDSDIADALDVFGEEYPTRERSASLGISCEACHYGAAEHVAQSTPDKSDLLPSFFPTSPHLHLPGNKAEDAVGRRPENLNFTCAKCHTGSRTEFASGHYTLNSAEFSDAVRGACYKPSGDAGKASMQALTCVHCHNPHEGIGKKWTRTPAQDDEKCLSCHQQFEPEAARTAHTHHPAGSSGARCMNCHMPKMHEGLQDAVRSHRIFSPNEVSNLEANHPNACNLCHLEENIDWTLTKLREWYGFEREPDASEIAKNYSRREGPVGLGWLVSPHHATRLAAGEALIRERKTWAIPALIDQLESDSFLINRQFTQRGLDKWLDVDTKGLGYRFYMTPDERKTGVAMIRPELLKRAKSVDAPKGD